MYTKKFYKIGKKLFPFFRSITGQGTLKTLNIIKENFIEFKIKKIKSGTKVFDWIIPAEWRIRKAYIIDKNNKKIVDIKNNNLHLVNYSTPIKKFISKNDLLKRMFSIKDKPNAIPYITSYYKKYWGFCVCHNQKKKIIKNYKKKEKNN